MSARTASPASRFAIRCGMALAGLLWICVASTLCGCNSVNGWVMNESGKAYYNRGDFTAARHEFERAAMDSPHNAHYSYNVAAAMQEQGDTMAAERMYQHALTLDPAHQPTYEALAHLLNAEGRTHEAEQLVTAWSETQPYIPESNLTLARMQQNRGDMAGAEQSIQRAMAAAPNKGKVKRELAKLYRKEGKNPEAAEMYGQALSANPYDAEAQAEMAALYQTQQTSSPALMMANQMPQYDPTLQGYGMVAGQGTAPYANSPALAGNVAPSIYPTYYGPAPARTLAPSFKWASPATVPMPADMNSQLAVRGVTPMPATMAPQMTYGSPVPAAGQPFFQASPVPTMAADPHAAPLWNQATAEPQPTPAAPMAAWNYGAAPMPNLVMPVGGQLYPAAVSPAAMQFTPAPSPLTPAAPPALSTVPTVAAF